MWSQCNTRSFLGVVLMHVYFILIFLYYFVHVSRIGAILGCYALNELRDLIVEIDGGNLNMCT